MDPNIYRDTHRSNTSSPLIPMFPQNPSIIHTHHHSQPNLHHPQQFQQPMQNAPYLHVQNPHQHQQHHLPPSPLPHLDLANTLNQLSQGQRELFESIRTLNSRMEANDRPNINPIDQLTSNLGGINLNRQQPPHRSHSRNVQHSPRPSYAPPPGPSRVSSPSEGAYARDPNRRLVYREPKPRENLCFSGESKMLRQFLLDIYDGLDQNVFDFASDKRRIIWITSHFSSNGSEINPAQSWFSSLLMQNAFEHGVVDQYANLKSLEFVIRPLL